MPIIPNVPSILEKVLTKNFSKNDYSETSENIYTTILDDLLLECTGRHMHQRSNTFTKCLDVSTKKPLLIVNELRNNLDKNQLNNLFNVLNQLKADIFALSDQLKNKSLSLVAYFIKMCEIKINGANNIFSENDVITYSEFLHFFSQALNTSATNELHTQELILNPNNGGIQTITFGESKPLEFFIGHANELIQHIIVILDFNKTIISDENLLSLFNQLGLFGFIVNKNFEFLRGITDVTLHKILDTQLVQNISKESAAWTYLNQYHPQDVDAIKGGCSELGFADCTPFKTQLFKDITSGMYLNSEPSSNDFKTVETEIFWSIHSNLNQEENACIFNFLKNYLKTNTNLVSKVELEKLLRFASHHIGELNKIKFYDHRFSASAENLSFLLFSIIKNHIGNDFEGQIRAINEFSKLYETVYQQAPHLTNLIDTLANRLFHMLARHIDQDTNLQTSTSVRSLILNLMSTCLQETHCSLYKISAKSFKSLGSLSRKNPNNLDIIQEAKLLSEKLRSKLSLEDLSNVASHFFKPNISQSKLNRQCKEIFNLTNCKPSSSINLDVNIDFDIDDELETTLSSITNSTNATTITLVPQTTTAAHNQTTSVIVDHNATTELPAYSNGTPSNQTFIETDANHNDSRLTNPGLTLGAAAAHGVGTGLLNGVIQYFAAKYSRHGQQASATKAMIIYSSLFVHATFAATFPLMLFKIQEHINQGNEDEAQQLWDSMLLQALPTFISSVGFTLGLQIVNECTQLLSNRFVRSVAQNTLPLLGTAVSLFKNPVASATQIGISIATSSLSYGLFNYISPIKNKINSSDKEAYENKDFECQEMIPFATPNKPDDEIKLFFQENKFITEENVKLIYKHLEIIIENTQCLSNKMVSVTFKNALDNLLEKTILDTPTGLKRDKMDLLAFISPSLLNEKEQEEQNNSEINLKRTPENLKTLLQTINKSLAESTTQQDSLNTILLRIEGVNFEDFTDEVSKSIKSIRTYSGFIVSLIKTALCNSSTTVIINSNQTFLRDKNGLANNRKCQSEYGDKTYSSGSGSSKDEENAQIVRPLLT